MRNKSKGGRPSKKTPDRVQRLLNAIALGLPYNMACAVSGLSFRTFCDWRQQDPSFAQKVDCAGAKAIERHLRLLDEAASNNPKISMWFLERRAPELFGKRDIHINVGPERLWETLESIPQREPMPKIGMSEAEKAIRDLEI